MKILYAASEVAPFIKIGGLGDVAGSLPKALAAKGHEVAVICPLYCQIKPEWRDKMYYLRNLYVQVAWRSQYCGIFVYEADGVKYYFLDNEYYFARNSVYGEYDDAERFAFFSRAILEMLPAIDFHPDVINCNDWQTALVPVYYGLDYNCRPWYSNIKTVFTIHNIQFQGQYGREILDYVLGIDDHHFQNGFMQQDGDVNLMKAAIVCSDRVTTVSQTYAQEIQTAFYGFRLDAVLRWNQGKVCGIVNGIDVDAFNPETDPHLFKNYGINSLDDKKINRSELLKMCGLEASDETMVIGMVGRLTSQKGLDLVQCVLNDILEKDVRMIVLGTGDYDYEQMFMRAKWEHPDKISTNIMFSADLANKIYAGCDLFLMPSLFEPCGLAQMIAMRYGTLPLVRETGGLKDTVQPYNQFTGEGTGFSFANYNAHEMLHVIEEAAALFRHDQKAWRQMQCNAMNRDFSWDRSAQAYIDLYQGI